MPHPIRSSLSPLSLVVAVLALVLSGAGIGYTAATVGTDDLENNAVVSKKVKNGSLKAVDLVKEKPFTRPVLGSGGDGDCLWSDAEDSIPGLSPVAYRTDRFGVTHLTGIALSMDGPGGDGVCGGMTDADALADYTIYTLPVKARPAASLYLPDPVGGGLLIIPGPGGVNLGGSLMIPPGAVLCSNGGSPCWLEGISFTTTRARVDPRATTPSKPVTPAGRKLLKQLLR